MAAFGDCKHLLSKLLSISIFLFLLLVTLRIIIDGPVNSSLRGETVFRETLMSLSDFAKQLRHPDFTICTIPSFKYHGIQKDLAQVETEEEFDEVLQRAFFTKSKETLLAVSMNNDIEKAATNAFEINVEEVAGTIQADMYWNGFCTNVSIERMLGKEFKDDTSYFAIAWLKGNHSADTAFSIKVHEPEETIVNGAFAMIPMKDVQLKAGECKLVHVTYEFEKRITQCNQRNELLTTCIWSYFSEAYGAGWQGYKKSVEIWTNLKIASPEVINNVTGCQIPCESFKYKLRQLAHFSLKHVPDRAFVSPFNGSIDGAIIALKHDRMTEIKVTEEVIKYTTEAFIAEVGGVVGIFLGLSFWSLFDIGAGLILRKA